MAGAADVVGPQVGSAESAGDAAGEAAEDGDLSIDDIFGTDETHEIEVVDEGEAGTGGAGKSEKKTGKDRFRSFRSKFNYRVNIVTSAYFDVHKTDDPGFGRNENRIEFRFSYRPNKHVDIVGDIEPVFFGVAQPRELDDLASRQMLAPFHVESDAAYVGLIDIFPGLDLKIGRQIVRWGTADQFNPTNNINSDDLEDRPLFTEPIANQMVVLEYAPLADKLWFQGVYVPLFYPALLPPSAASALQDPQAEVPFVNDADQIAIDELRRLMNLDPRLVPEVTSTVRMPDRSFRNGQFATKIGTSVGGVDMSASYYYGRHDIPTPVDAESSTIDPVVGDGMSEECCFTSNVTLVYPKMQVVGADFATQVPFLANMGLWGEGALFIPERHNLHIEFPVPVDITPDDGVPNAVLEMTGRTIRKRLFVKVTAGLDHSIGKHVYLQGQYLRGFIDEFGAGHIGNYLVAGGDLIFFGRHLIFRAFGVVDFPTGKGDDGSYVVYPEVIITPPWGHVKLQVGSFFLLGKRDTKFGQPAAGTSIVFTKVTGSF